MVSYSIIFQHTSADPNQVVSCRTGQTEIPSSACPAIWRQRTADVPGIAALLRGVSQASTCNCSAAKPFERCSCVAKSKAGQPCPGTNYAAWTMEAFPLNSGGIGFLPLSYSNSQHVKVEGFCQDVREDSEWPHLETVTSSSVDAAVFDFVAAIPAGTCQ